MGGGGGGGGGLLSRALEHGLAALFFILLIGAGVAAAATLVLLYPLLLLFDRRWLVAPRLTCISSYVIGRLFVRLEVEARAALARSLLALARPPAAPCARVRAACGPPPIHPPRLPPAPARLRARPRPPARPPACARRAGSTRRRALATR